MKRALALLLVSALSLSPAVRLLHRTRRGAAFRRTHFP